MSTPQTPDSLEKSRQDKTPPREPRDEPPEALSNEHEGDRAEPRQGGH